MTSDGTPASSDEQAPPLPDEEVPALPEESPPPLPDEELPAAHALEDAPAIDVASSHTQDSNQQSDGWRAILDPTSQEYYFYNTNTLETTWTNPRTQSTAEAKTATTGEEETQDTRDLAFEARFSRRTGRFVSNPNHSVEHHSIDARAGRQMDSFFDTTAHPDASSASLLAERRAIKYSKEEIKAFKAKHKEKRDQRRRAWLTKD